MNDTCHLIIDSCCDIPAEMLDDENITLLKFPYVLNGGTFEDDLFQSVSAKEFYDGMRKGAEPTTAQLTIPLLQETFTKAAKRGIPTVYLSFTSGLSGSFDTAMLVRDQICEEYPDFELYIVDTLAASVKEGLLAFEAITQRAKGLSAKELADWATEARYFIDCEFMIEDLDVLKRGGRIPASVAVAGSALDVKPLLSIDSEGKLQVVGISRGRKKGLAQLAEYFKKNVSNEGRSKYVFLGNADAPKDAQRLKSIIEKDTDGQDYMFIDCSVGPVIGSHVGPGMVAVAFWSDDCRKKLSIADKIARKVKGSK